MDGLATLLGLLSQGVHIIHIQEVNYADIVAPEPPEGDDLEKRLIEVLKTPAKEITPDVVHRYASLVFNEAFGCEDFFAYLEQLYKDIPTVSPKCGVSVTKADRFVYKCLDCQKTDGSLICANCYDHGNHEGHRIVREVKQIEGTCDCGDRDILKPEGFCSLHSGRVDIK
jgi:hypothetical protein